MQTQIFHCELNTHTPKEKDKLNKTNQALHVELTAVYVETNKLLNYRNPKTNTPELK